MKVLVLFAHPALERSRVNRSLLRAITDIPGLTKHDLYETYPDLNIDVKREQELLLNHDVVVFQSPFYWYSTPAMIKEWQDLVLTHGWAYGAGGRALAGKITFNALTTGGPKDSYTQLGYNRFTVRQLLAPHEATANLCGMRYLPPFLVHNVMVPSECDSEKAARSYRRLMEALVDGRLDLERASQAQDLHHDLASLLAPTLSIVEDG